MTSAFQLFLVASHTEEEISELGERGEMRSARLSAAV